MSVLKKVGSLGLRYLLNPEAHLLGLLEAGQAEPSAGLFLPWH